MPLTFPQMPDKLTANETTILEYLNRNSNAFLFLNIAQLAAALDVSEATISRFARHVGCRDFKNLKQVVLGQVEQPGPVQKKTAVSAGEEDKLLSCFLEQQKYCLERTLELLDKTQFEQAAQAVADARRVYVYAKNGSRSMAELLTFRLWRIGVDIHRLSAGGSELLEGLATAGPEDLVVVFSFSSQRFHTGPGCPNKVQNAAVYRPRHAGSGAPGGLPAVCLPGGGNRVPFHGGTRCVGGCPGTGGIGPAWPKGSRTAGTAAQSEKTLQQTLMGQGNARSGPGAVSLPGGGTAPFLFRLPTAGKTLHLPGGNRPLF